MPFPALVYSFVLLFLAFASPIIAEDAPNADWRILFDGTSTDAFRGWNSDRFPTKGWKIDDGCLICEKTNGRPNGGGGDIVTKESFDDFELRWEWKLADKGNSGVKYFVRNRERFAKGQELFGGDDGKALVGHEYQMLDDANHPDAKNGPLRRTASFYHIIAPKNAKLRPPNEFNESRLLVDGNHVEHWLNGVKVLEYEAGSEAVLETVAKTKYRFIDGFGEKRTSPILFQDHGDELWLRNIRIRKIEHGDVVLSKNAVRIVLDPHEPEPLKLAVKTLIRDFRTVMDFEPTIVDSIDKAGNGTVLVVQNDAVERKSDETVRRPPLDGFESHRVSTDPKRDIVFLHGNDMRGTIYAVYTFSERFLGVPPLWYFSSWTPDKRDEIIVPRDTILDFKSPQVRYRAWFPNDTDMFSPWRKRSEENDTLWLETMLRLKLNTVELGTTIRYPGKMSDDAMLLKRFGLVLTSHHMIALNSGFGNWEPYWKSVKKEKAPELLLRNEKETIDFYRYNIETVLASGVENLWQIAFRGDGDKPFWATFKDAPATDPERAEIINRMLKIQLGLIREITGEKEPFVRMTFYDELSDLLAAGTLKPPTGGNMIWTFCSARRDHYPNDDIVHFDTNRDVKLGYYMNFQFTSTGSHLAPAEGPWKMEANYRYVDGKKPLYFSVVNAGNLREHLLELSANAAMLWDFKAYDSNNFLLRYCEKYFGKEHAAEVAEMYRDYYDAYWEPTRSTFPGMERQFLFHDLRHARAMRMIADQFSTFDPDPLKDVGFERMPGRTFRITPSDNDATNSVDAILNGTKTAAVKFERVADRCDALRDRLPARSREFFGDNLRGYARFMAGLSRSLYDFTHAYKHRSDRTVCATDLQRSLEAMESARQALLQTQHGVFDRWYDGDAAGGKFNMPRIVKQIRNIAAKNDPK